MTWWQLIVGIVLVVLVLWDTFETMILPRNVTSTVRLPYFVNRVLWRAWRNTVKRLIGSRFQERYLGIYGPLSVLIMLAIWAVALVFGFALISAGLGSHWVGADAVATFKTDLYVSGTTLFTLGLGDVHPVGLPTRALMVVEAGTGFGFLAVGISYLPVLYQSFSRREVQITLLDVWAGSPPSAMEMFRRLASVHAIDTVPAFLTDWGRWCAELVEGHISYPQVAYFRSQHGKQSWVASLTAVLDVSALVLAGVRGIPQWQARVTFEIARHAAADLCQVLHVAPLEGRRLALDHCEQIVARLESAGLQFEDDDAPKRLLGFRKLYEPFVSGLAAELAMPLPPWIREGSAKGSWEVGPKSTIEELL